MDQILKYEWKHDLIEFEVINGNVMVNATQMAKAFDKRIDHFLKSEHANEFINVLEFPPFGGNSASLKRDEIIQTKGKSGTWMHRILALKFAAWLDAGFELWVYSTIDRILFDHYRKMEESLRRSAARQVRINKIKEELNDVPGFMELQQLELEERQEAYRRSKENKDQLELFKSGEQDTSQ